MYYKQPSIYNILHVTTELQLWKICIAISFIHYIYICMYLYNVCTLGIILNASSYFSNNFVEIHKSQKMFSFFILECLFGDCLEGRSITYIPEINNILNHFYQKRSFSITCFVTHSVTLFFLIISKLIKIGTPNLAHLTCSL